MMDGMMKKKKLSPIEAKAKMNVLEQLKSEMQDMMGEHMKDGMMKKVTVASPDEEGLQEGLDKAKEVLGHEDSNDMKEESPEHEASEMPEEEMAEHDDNDDEPQTEEEIDAKIHELLMKKKSLKGM